MKNKVELKKAIIASIAVALIFVVLFILIFKAEYKEYTNNFNTKLGAIFSKIVEEYKEVETSDLMAILNSEEDVNNELFKKYGIDLSEDSAILENDNKFNQFVLLNVCHIINCVLKIQS